MAMYSFKFAPKHNNLSLSSIFGALKKKKRVEAKSMYIHAYIHIYIYRDGEREGGSNEERNVLDER